LQRLAHVDQSDRDTWTNQIAPRRSRPRSRPALSPRQCVASLSPPSRPPLARAGTPARARARRYRPLSPGASAIARRRPLARLSPARGRQRPLLARAAARIGTSLIVIVPSISFVFSSTSSFFLLGHFLGQHVDPFMLSSMSTID
jgi:hypothetical protein